MPSSATEATGDESEEEDFNSAMTMKDCNCVSSKAEDDDTQPGTKWNDLSSTSSTTNELPSSASDTESTVGVRHLAAHPSGLPTFAAAAAAAAPPVPPREKKPRRAGFREQFLQQLRVMLDRESQNDSTTVRWSPDGTSFIIMDQSQFQEQTIPIYFDNPIVFASFLRKLQRWGFKQVSRRRTGRYESEFGSPTFKRLDDGRAPATAAVNTCSIAGGGASIQIQQQSSTQAFSPLLQQVMTQTNQLPASKPLPSQTDANAATPGLISNIQRQHSSQQPTIPSQHSVLNRNTDNANNYSDTNSILEGTMGSNQQRLPSPYPTLSQQSMPDNANQYNDVGTNIYLEVFQQWQNPTPR